MSYRKPKSDTQLIQAKYANVNKGLQNLFGNLNKTFDGFVKAEKAKIAKSRKILSKETSATEVEFDKKYQQIQGQLDKFTGGLTKKKVAKVDKNNQPVLDASGNQVYELKESEDALDLKTQVTHELVRMRDDLAKRISDLGPNATIREIKSIKSEMTGTMDSLFNDMVSWETARQEYMAAKELDPDDVNAIMPGYNDNLIAMFEALEDDERNLLLTRDPDSNHWRISQFEGTQDNIVETINVSDWSTKHQGKKFFKHVEKLPGYEHAQKSIKTKLSPDALDIDEYKDASGNVDVVKLKAYFTTGPGRISMQPYVDEDDKQGHWRQLATPQTTKRTSTEWQTHDEAYNDEAFLGKIIDNALIDMGLTTFDKNKKAITTFPQKKK